ncbi:hypothetical protein [Rhizohabitans arisaemae]|uniref:hypothetical protein n=1 Tax=Rhizohabitans arisaemae TaxID=2720610 RepID=UPI0024B099CC|nr:hypothetical protein [Rhizohabitans arisaemae]
MTGITSPWALVWAVAHKQATRSDVILQQGHTIHAGGGVPAALSTEPGQVSAEVTPRHAEPVRAVIRIALLSPDEQQIIAAALAAGPHKPALLKGQRPAALTDPAHTGDIPIAPRAEHLSFACDCGQAPCRHTAALGHALTQRLQANPSLMTTLRGLPHRHLTGLLQAPAPAAPATPAQHDKPCTPTRPPRPAGPHVAAHQAYRGYDPSVPPQPVPARETAVDSSDGARSAQFADAELPEPPAPAPPLRLLSHLTAEAARQAQQVLDDGALFETDPVADAVRLIASLPAAERAEIVAYRLDMELHTLRSLVAAYDLAGTPGIHAARHLYPDDPQVLQQAAAAIAPLRPDPAVPLSIADNHVTDPAAGIEIRHGQDSRWYPFATAGHDWQLVASASDDPHSAYQSALTALRTRPR